MYQPIQRVYSGVLAFCLRHRWIVLLAIVASFASCIAVVKKVGGDFLPPNDEAQFEIYVQAPEGTTLEQTTLTSERIARQVRMMPEVDASLVTIAAGDARSANIGNVYVHMVDPDKRVRSEAEVMEDVRKTVLPSVPNGTRVAVQQVNDFSIGTQNAVISYLISGPDLDKLEKYGNQVLATMKKVPGVVDLDSSLVDPIDETMVTPDLDRAGLLGVDPGDITNTLSILVGGVDVSTFEDRGDQYQVFLRAAERFRNDPTSLSLISVPSRTLGQVPLTDVIKLGASKSTSKITRQSRERAVTITSNVSPGFSQSDISKQFENAFKSLDLPPGYTYEPFGQSKEFGKMQKAFAFAIGLAIVFMYLVLAAQFESLALPVHHHAVAAADAAVRGVLAADHRRFAQHLLDARHHRAVRDGQEERDSSGRSRERPAPARPAAHRGGARCEPRPSAADPDDHPRVRRRHDAADRQQRRRLRLLEGDGVRCRRWSDAVAAANARRDPRHLYVGRRPCCEHEAPLGALVPTDRPRRGGGRRRRLACGVQTRPRVAARVALTARS